MLCTLIIANAITDTERGNDQREHSDQTFHRQHRATPPFGIDESIETEGFSSPSVQRADRLTKS